MVKDPWQILIPDQIKSDGVQILEAFGTTTRVSDAARDGPLSDAISKFDAIVLRTLEVDEELLANADDLKVISKHGPGLDNVDIPAASRRDIVVCNTPGSNARAVAEHALCLLFSTNNSLIVADRHVRSGRWERQKFMRMELQDRTVGLFGCGAIGREVAAMASGCGLSCLAYDPYLSPEAVPEAVSMVDSKRALFETADVVSVHAPLTDETRHAIGATELAALGNDGLLINTSRGGIVDQTALIAALEDGDLYGAGLDTFEREPPECDDLFDLDNVVLSPHIGGAANGARRQTAIRAAENVETVLQGDLPESTVNADRIDRS